MRQINDWQDDFEALEPTDGKIIFDNIDITKFSRRQMRPLRQQMQMVFQDPVLIRRSKTDGYAAYK